MASSPSDGYLLLQYEYPDHASSDRIVTLKVTKTCKVQYLSSSGDVTREEDQVAQRCRSTTVILPPFTSEFDAFREYLCFEIKDGICRELLLSPVVYDMIMPVIVSKILRDVGNEPGRSFCLSVKVAMVAVVQKNDMRWPHRYANGALVIDLTRRSLQLPETPIEQHRAARVPSGRGGYRYENGALIIDLKRGPDLPPAEGRLKMQLFFAHQRSCTGCAICLEDFCDGGVIAVLPCSHIFHRSCITMWFKCNNSCPTCRRSFVINAD